MERREKHSLEWDHLMRQDWRGSRQSCKPVKYNIVRPQSNMWENTLLMIVGYISPRFIKIPVVTRFTRFHKPGLPFLNCILFLTVHPFLSLLTHFILSFLLPSINFYVYFAIARANLYLRFNLSHIHYRQFSTLTVLSPHARADLAMT